MQRIVIVGGGHNGLVAAAYLARAGRDVLVLEQSDHFGGAAVSVDAFPGVAAHLSRYSYLVSLMPQQIIDELGIDVEMRSRAVASYTPLVRDGVATGLMVERQAGPMTEESFRAVTGGDADYAAWNSFYSRMEAVAQIIAPTMLSPLPDVSDIRQQCIDAVGEEFWKDIAERPIGELLHRDFVDDDVRGVIATDALIGTFASVYDDNLLANRCLLYHLIGNGTGEWRVPVGGMGAVTTDLARIARDAGAQLVPNANVTAVRTDGSTAEVTWATPHGTVETVECQWVLANVAPVILERLLGNEPQEFIQGSQLKINMVLERLPELKSGVPAELAFRGTFHIDESLSALESAYRETAEGRFPGNVAGEIYCHTLTDPSILSPELQAAGWHTMTLFGIHLPPQVFSGDHEVAKQKAVDAFLDAISAHLTEPLINCIARDSNGNLCIEARTPDELEQDVLLPGGHIFHRDLRWPWSEGTDPDSVPGAWGVETAHANVLVCGAGARRGGGVSGIPGHNAAMAVLEKND